MFVKLSEIKTKKVTKHGGNLKSSQQIRDDFVSFLKTIGVDYFIFWDLMVPEYYYLEKQSAYTNYPGFIMNYYIENGYFNIDPILETIENLDKEYFITRDVIADLEKTKELTSLEKQYFYDLKSVGFDNGITIKIQDPICILGINSFSGNTEEIYLQNKDVIIHEFMSYRSALMSLLSKKPKIIFSEKERECLSLIAQGKTTWEISKIMDISERSVNTHINSFIKKLGASSRTHAVAIAIEKKLIKMNDCLI